ncbi:metalloprotease-like protein [Beauveria bassiana ARSEF 2860]|uniref:Metalloprotease-like protein n=1 Tax=Beauveria bassiana (strain ARSEF 2860) TaxID=655819 RepID=J5J523_BEAB2|nr:metalloprotease-like protein [Beauveria bassiana ARSEF 2860]EJP61723.1 metalloprotease-like protein [Beauveria bassiana ARSEF 2860]
MLPFILCASFWLALLAPIVAMEDELATTHRNLAAAERELARKNQSTVHPQLDTLKKQLDVLNTHFQPANFSFIVQDIEWVSNKRLTSFSYPQGASYYHKGDKSSLNIYFVKHISDQVGLILGGESPTPDLLKQYPLQDGVRIAAGTVPGGSFEFYNKGLTVVHEVGHWIGLAHTFEGGCDGEGDFIDDTPASANASRGCQINRNSCPGRDGLDPIHNIMDYSAESEFTRGQIDRMHGLWKKYRSPSQGSDTQPRPWRLWIPSKPVRQTHKLPFFPDPWNIDLAKQRCRRNTEGSAEEHRESYCGTNLYCQERLYEFGNGEKYADTATCLSVRTDPQSNEPYTELLPWTMRTAPDESCRQFTSANYFLEQLCGTDIFCKGFDLPSQVTISDAHGQSAWGKYNSSSSCFEDHDPAPAAPLTHTVEPTPSLTTVQVRQCPRTGYKLEVLEGQVCPDGTKAQEWKPGMPNPTKGASGCYHFTANCQ